MTVQNTATRTTAGNALRLPGDNALAVAERSFLLLTTGPKPLAIDGHLVGHGLPDRPVDLVELRNLLLERSSHDPAKDAVWKELVQRSRSGDPAWVVGCVGVAMPGLKNTAVQVLRVSPERCADDIVSELLTEFVAQLARMDLGRPHIAARLMHWAQKGALRARGREARLVPCNPWELPGHPTSARAEGDPIVLLLDAVRQEIITPEAAELIIATRLEGVAVQEIIRRRKLSANGLYRKREAAEASLVTAIRTGRISATSTTANSQW